MSDAVTAIVCTALLATGWFYLARSRLVDQLVGFESPRRNATRRRTRRLGAWSMIVLGASWFWLMWELQAYRNSPSRRMMALLLVGLSLMTMMLTLMVDLYLTIRLRHSNRPPRT